MKNPWKTVSSKEIYENKWIQLTEHQVIHPGGKPGIYGLIHFKNTAVGIIPLDENYNTWIIGQYRYTLNQYSWEIPEGGGELTVEPLESAKRELLEETGIKANQWEEILRLDLSNSVTDERGIVYVAKDLTFHYPQPDEDEQLEIRKLPFSELFEMVMQGKVSDGLSIAAIFKAQYLIQKGLL